MSQTEYKHQAWGPNGPMTQEEYDKIVQGVRQPIWSPESHLGALTDRPAPTSGKIIPGKSRRLKRK